MPGIFLFCIKYLFSFLPTLTRQCLTPRRDCRIPSFICERDLKIRRNPSSLGRAPL